MQTNLAEISLKGKRAFISGGTRGLGLDIAKTFVGMGANVAFCGRSTTEVSKAEKDLRALNSPFGDYQVEGFVTDIANYDQVKKLKSEVNNDFGQIDILICNAGVIGPMSKFLTNDLEKWISALNINLLGSVFLTKAFLPSMIESGKGKIVQLSGGGAASPLPGLSSYAASKAGVIRFIETLAEEYKDAGVDINAVAPGMLKTRMLDEMLEAGPNLVGEKLYKKSVAKAADQVDSSEKACELITFLASSLSDGITGKLISAEWDNWTEWPNHIEELRNSDLYTLRRIVGNDRGHTWGDI
jgi:NAD(P)-dependent dehydrogenase (short-subunit alcohol dehydrogenase family)